jgi:hypothetical protein
MKKITLNPFLDIKECWWTIDEEPYKFQKGIWKEVDEDTWSSMRQMMKTSNKKVLQVFIAEDETIVHKDVIERFEV